MELKSSPEWRALVPKNWQLLILDPAGWDRNNFKFAYNHEKITKEEYLKRLQSSTIRCNAEYFGKW